MQRNTSGPYTSAYEIASKRPPRPGRWGWLVAFALLMVWIASVEPRAGVTPSCPTLSILGFPCPGCGSLRAIHALLHGHISAAWDLNAVTTTLLPIVGLLTVPPIRDWVGEVHDAHPGVIGTATFAIVAITFGYWLTRAL